MSQDPTPRVPVAVIGAGPVGLTVALELAHQGVRSVLIDRAASPTQFPKMDVTNGRSMELFRRWGLAARLRAAGVPPAHNFDVIWTRDFNQPPVAVWHQPSAQEQTERLRSLSDGSGPLEADMRMPQYTFEALVREQCRAHPLIDFREGCAFDALAQDQQGVSVQVSGGPEAVIRAAYAVGCDGAGSAVRRLLGIALEGEALPRAVMFHFKSRDHETLHRHGRFWHVYAPGVAVIAQDEVDTWTAHFTWPPGVEPDTDATLPDLLQQRLGVAVKIDEILLHTVWQPRMMLAQQYGLGRVFLAGDAVHQVFPTGGYGMNTGIGDAVDIGWKLAAVIKGWAGSALLQSYEAERRPVAATNRDYAGRHLGVLIEFQRQLAEGVPCADVARFVQTHTGENTSDGVEFGYRYTHSPVVCHEAGVETVWEAERYVPGTWPGGRAPSLFRADGSALFDHLGPGFTLVDFSGSGAQLVSMAQTLGMPLHHLHVSEPQIRQAWERDLVLVRPDQHVAWRGHTPPEPQAWRRILDRVRGA